MSESIQLTKQKVRTLLTTMWRGLCLFCVYHHSGVSVVLSGLAFKAALLY